MKRLLMLVSILGVTACQAVTVEKKKIKVMIVDTGIAPIAQLKDFLDPASELSDSHGHGTHIAGLVVYGAELNDPVCREVEIYSCKTFTKEQTTTDCFEKAKKLKVKYVNFSGGGEDYSAREEAAIKALKAKVVVAAGNEYSDLKLKPYYPASLNLPNLVAVANGANASSRAASSNYGLPKLKWRNGTSVSSFSTTGSLVSISGTSQAAAIYTHGLLKKACQRLRSAK